MGLDQVSIDHIVSKERINMLVARFFRWTVEFQLLPVANARHQLNTQQVRETKHRKVLALRIRVNSGWLDRGLIAHQDI